MGDYLKIIDVDCLSLEQKQTLKIWRKKGAFLLPLNNEENTQELSSAILSAYFYHTYQEFVANTQNPGLIKAISVIYGVRLGDMFCENGWEWKSLLVDNHKSKPFWKEGIVSPNKKLFGFPDISASDYIAKSYESYSDVQSCLFLAKSLDSAEELNLFDQHIPRSYKSISLLTDEQIEQREIIINNPKRISKFKLLQLELHKILIKVEFFNILDNFRKLHGMPEYDYLDVIGGKYITNPKYFLFPSGFFKLMIDGALDFDSGESISNDELLLLFSTNIKRELKDLGYVLPYDPNLTLLPLPDFNAQSIKFDNGYIVAVNYGLIDAVSSIASLITSFIVFGSLTNWVDQKYSKISWVLVLLWSIITQDNDEIHRATREINIADSKLKLDSNNLKQPSDKDAGVVITTQIRYSIMHFVLAHEYGHFCLGHVKNSKSMFVKNKSDQEKIEIVDEEWQEELDADSFAFKMLQENSNRTQGMTDIEYVSIYIFFQLHTLLLNMYQVDNETLPEPNLKTHPDTSIRVENLLSHIKNSEEPNIYEETKKITNLVDMFFKILHKIYQQANGKSNLS